MRKPIAALTAVHTDVAPSTAWARSLCRIARRITRHSTRSHNGVVRPRSLQIGRLSFSQGASWASRSRVVRMAATGVPGKGHARRHFASCSGFGSECSLARGESQSLQACADDRRATSLVCAARSRASFSTACLDRWTRKGGGTSSVIPTKTSGLKSRRQHGFRQAGIASGRGGADVRVGSIALKKSKIE